MIKLNPASLRFNAFLLLLLFQNAFSGHVELGALSRAFAYFDEALAALAFAYCFRVAVTDKMRVKENVFLFIGISLVLTGILSNFRAGLIRPKPMLIDAIACFKFFVVLSASICYFRCHKRTSKLIAGANSLCRALAFVSATLVLVDIFIYEVFPGTDFRSFFRSQRLVFIHPSDLADFGIYLFSFLMLNNSKGKNTPYLILDTIVIFSTMRHKQMAAVAVFWLLYFYYKLMKFHSNAIPLFCAGVISAFISYDMLFLYYVSDIKTARGMLMKVGLQIANAYFPLGTGLGNFASSAATVYYSPLYFKYGLNRVWGLGGDNMTFLSDTFWPIVFGQFGWVGFALVSACFYALFKMCFRLQKQGANLRFICFYGLVLYLLCMSFGLPCLFHVSSVTTAILLSIIYSTTKAGKNEKKYTLDVFC